MLYFHKLVEFSKAIFSVYHISKNYLLLLQQIANSLKKIDLVGTPVWNGTKISIWNKPEWNDRFQKWNGKQSIKPIPY